MVEEGLSIDQIELLRDRGLTCSRLRQLENKELRDSKNAYKEASKLRSLGFQSGADIQEKVANAQKQLANAHRVLGKKSVIKIEKNMEDDFGIGIEKSNNKTIIIVVIIISIILVLGLIFLLNKPISNQCQTDFSCTNWGSCSNNQQTRTCTDLNGCNSSNIPILIQSCNISCNPSWNCSSWSSCSNNQQTRVCSDLNSCGSNTGKPLESQSCNSNQCTPNWVVTEDWGVNGCTQNNREVRTSHDVNNCEDPSGGSSSFLNWMQEYRDCYTGNNTDLNSIKNQYNSYFNSNPRVKNIITNYLSNLNSVDAPTYTWDDFYNYLRAEENNTNVGNDYDAVKLMAHSVYIDNNNLVPWKLNDYDDEGLKDILRPTYDYGLFQGNYGSYGYNPGYVSTCKPRETYSYAKNLLRADQKSTVIAIVGFMGKYHHYGYNCDNNGNCVPSSNLPVSGCDEGVLGNDQIDGCHASSQLMVDLARSLNIPAWYHYDHWCHNWFVYGHGSAVFYQIGYIPHGDDVYWGNESSACHLIVPWNTLINNVIPFEGNNPQNDLHGPLCTSYYHLNEGYNPGYQNYRQNFTLSLYQVNGIC